MLLGAILPRVAAQWHLRDKDAGLLLLVQFAGSASGALFARRNLWRTLACGYALCGVGAAAIFALQQSAFPWVLVAFSTFGLGLGLAMTSTNLLVGRQTGSRRGAALALLNFSWSAGSRPLSPRGRADSPRNQHRNHLRRNGTAAWLLCASTGDDSGSGPKPTGYWGGP